MADIELVIKIPEELLNKIDDENYQGVIWWYDATLYCAIKNGTPLPKGHGRLKDENEIKQMIEDAKVENEFSKNFAENIIKFAPTIIEADKGEWRCN